MNFAIEQLKIEGLFLVHSKRFDDLRGHFLEAWSRDAFRRVGIDWPFDTAGAVLSPKDSSLPPFADFSSPFPWEEGDVVEPSSRAAVPA